MTSKKELDTEWTKYLAKAKQEGKTPLPFKDWYKERYGSEPPNFIQEQYGKPSIDDSSITDYILSKIGAEPDAWGSKRRWRFLMLIALFLSEQKEIGLNQFFVWTTANCQCIKMRTLRDDYLDTLDRIGLIDFDLKTGKIKNAMIKLRIKERIVVRNDSTIN